MASKFEKGARPLGDASAGFFDVTWTCYAVVRN